MRDMLDGNIRMKSLPNETFEVLIGFCENQRDCMYCPFYKQESGCMLKDNWGRNPEEWEVLDELDWLD